MYKDKITKSLTRRQFIKVAAGTLGIGLAGCAFEKRAKVNYPFSFGVVADVQYADYPARGNRYYRRSKWKLSKCVEDFNSRDLSFVIQLGDFIDGGFNNFDRMLAIYQQLKMPRYHVLGNHDFAADRQRVLDKLGLAKGYYDFSVMGWRFIVLDGNEISMYANPKDNTEYKQAKTIHGKLKETGDLNAVTYNGTLSSQQLTWLKNKLDKACTSGEKVIIFCHFPVFPPNVHNLWDNSEMVAFFESYDCVAAYMNGHNHAGNYAQKSNIHYLTLHAMVESPDKTAYAVVEVYLDHLKIIGFGDEPSRTLFIGS